MSQSIFGAIFSIPTSAQSLVRFRCVAPCGKKGKTGLYKAKLKVVLSALLDCRLNKEDYAKISQIILDFIGNKDTKGRMMFI
jgi:hypothetical protein